MNREVREKQREREMEMGGTRFRAVWLRKKEINKERRGEHGVIAIAIE